MLKTIATCKPSEFLRQTNRLRKTAEKWLKDTDILNIRRDAPELKKAPEGASAEERAKIDELNRELIGEQAKKNLSRILDAMLEEHPDETLELLALCCFVEPEQVDEHNIDEYLEAIGGILGNRAVLGFFTSLVQLGQKSI